MENKIHYFIIKIIKQIEKKTFFLKSLAKKQSKFFNRGRILEYSLATDTYFPSPGAPRDGEYWPVVILLFFATTAAGSNLQNDCGAVWHKHSPLELLIW